ncbi:LysR family transcriptional regulator [Pleionea sediminis]|uniref:LysR family transcriptional regulator n=1 Tax=Pleionea sediminis TaxID=2569479 RepID=UPI001186A4B4|nr:LysR family transcriptional regulator [Pleionea sediminis]
MDYQSLKVFLAVARFRSFTEASEHLFLTQPAVSKRIKSLEDDLGCLLFDRVGHQIELTSAGKLLKLEASKILREIEFTRQKIKNLNKGISGPLSIVTSHHIGLHRLPPILQHLRQNFPDIDLSVQFMDSEEAYAGVLDGEIECALLTLPKYIDKQVKAFTIWQDKLRVFCASNSELASIKKLHYQHLNDYPVILPEKKTFTREAIITYLKEKQVHCNEVRAGDYLETIKTLVECDLGWSVLPEALNNPKLKLINHLDFDLTRTLGLIHHKKRPLSKAGERLLKTLKEM